MFGNVQEKKLIQSTERKIPSGNNIMSSAFCNYLRYGIFIKPYQLKLYPGSMINCRDEEKQIFNYKLRQDRCVLRNDFEN